MKINEVKTVVDSQRGCGWRKAGGLYLRSDGISSPCGKLPVELTACPCCGAGVKPARGWTWVNAELLMKDKVCPNDPDRCRLCPMYQPPVKAGLLWVGEKFYPRPEDWISEANRLGVSRRITMVPKGFEAGRDWVFMAHRKAIPHFTLEKCDCGCEAGKDEHTEKCAGYGFLPAMFHAFKPTRIEYVCRGNETEKQLDALVRRHIEPVRVTRDTDLKGMPEAGEREAMEIEAGQR